MENHKNEKCRQYNLLSVLRFQTIVFYSKSKNRKNEKCRQYSILNVSRFQKHVFYSNSNNRKSEKCRQYSILSVSRFQKHVFYIKSNNRKSEKCRQYSTLGTLACLQIEKALCFSMNSVFQKYPENQDCRQFHVFDTHWSYRFGRLADRLIISILFRVFSGCPVASRPPLFSSPGPQPH